MAAPPLLHDFFERAQRRWPQRVALEIPPGAGRAARLRLTYAQLDERTSQVATRLAAHVRGESTIAILLSRSSEHLLAAQLGVLRAGAAFVCLEPASPDAMVRAILEDAAPAVILTDAAGTRRLDGRAGTIPIIDVAGRPVSHATVEEASIGLPRSKPVAGPRSLAYLIYTSGTTGGPKGVMIEHRSISNLVAADLDEFRLVPDDRVAQGSSPAYDSSIEETWLALAAGATLVVLDEETIRSGPDLVPWLRREGITVFCPPPTLLRATGCEDPRAALPALRLLYVGGEALPDDVAERWGRGRRLVNGYGPTECTVTCLRGDVRPGEAITIGMPTAGAIAAVLDESLVEVPDGTRGELCVGGLAAARGYRNLEALTRERFIDHPRLGRAYRTGDLVHRLADGRFVFHGRMDGQVKLRGHRVELGDIEARLAGCPGVKAAACTVQGDGDRRILVAHVVPRDHAAPPGSDELRSALRGQLPEHMVPSRFGMLSALPTTVGGKLDRASLPLLAAREGWHDALPRTPLERAIAEVLTIALRRSEPVAVDADFFHDLGGDSLAAAVAVSLLRRDPRTTHLAVRDLYERRTVAALAVVGGARLAAAPEGGDAASAPRAGRKPAMTPFVVGCAQAAWLACGAALLAVPAWIVAIEVLPALVERLGVAASVLLGPLLAAIGVTLYTPVSIAFAVCVKRLLIGRYEPGRASAWSAYFLRAWMVQRAVRLVPWPLLEGTIFQQQALRALGATIGRRVHIDRGVNLAVGGWDLLIIGDDASIGRDASLRMVDYEDGAMLVGPVVVGEGAIVEVRAGVGPGARLGRGSELAALASLPAGAAIPDGERWDGVPARCAGPARSGLAPWCHPESSSARVPSCRSTGSPLLTSALMSLGRVASAILLAIPLQLSSLWFLAAQGIDATALRAWLEAPSVAPVLLVEALLALVLPVPASLLLAAALLRAMGKVPSGAIPRFSPAYARVWLKIGLVEAAGEWLSGTLLWPAWLRLAGLRVGRGCEISTVMEVVPELVTIAGGSFLADGIYLGGPRVSHASVALDPVVLGRGTFLGNHVVVSGGASTPEDVLVGVCTRIDAPVGEGAAMRPGTSWFGHPAFELPRREVVQVDRSLTHQPSAIRRVNRILWELMRFALPMVPALVLAGAYTALAALEPRAPRWAFLLVAVPGASLVVAGTLAAWIVFLKWVLLWRVRPAQTHPLWSCWCSRWDFLYVAWNRHGRAVLSALEGTPMLALVLRSMGVRIGRRVVLASGLAQVVDPDMLVIEDDATVSGMFQAHTFEDRVLKIDRVTIRRGATVAAGAVLLYGAELGEDAIVEPHSVVMKHEVLPARGRYVGVPTVACARG